MNIRRVRAALADRLAQVQAVESKPYALSQPTPPGFQILPPGRIYHYAAGVDEWTYIIQAFVAFTTDIGSQQLLDDMIGDSATSVQGLLEADRTLGGLVESLTVVESSPGRMVENPPGNPMLLVEFRVTMLAERD